MSARGSRVVALVTAAGASERPAPTPLLPTRRERLGAAAEAFAFLRRLVSDERADLALRARVACVLLDQAKGRHGEWRTMPGEAPSPYAFLPSDVPAAGGDEGEE